MEVLEIKASNITEELIKFKTLLETKEVFIYFKVQQDADLVNQILNRLDQIEVSYDDLYVILNNKIFKYLEHKNREDFKKTYKKKGQ